MLSNIHTPLPARSSASKERASAEGAAAKQGLDPLLAEQSSDALRLEQLENRLRELGRRRAQLKVTRACPARVGESHDLERSHFLALCQAEHGQPSKGWHAEPQS